MPTPTLSLSMIVRDNAPIIGPCLRSIAPHVNEIVIVDTGSSDETRAEILKVAPAARIYDFNHKTNPDSFLLDAAETWQNEIPGPFSGKYMLADFGAARNFGWQRITCDYGMWIDSDDLVQGAERLPEILNDMQAHSVDTAMLNYDYSTDNFGNVNMKLIRERVVRRAFGAYWKQPVHELLVPGGVQRLYDTINIAHQRARYGLPAAFHHRNLKILYKWWMREGTAENRKNIDPRLLFYLGMEERFLWPDRAIEHFTLYCKLSGWDEERAAAHVICGQIHEHFQRHAEAQAEFAQAVVEFPPSPDGYFGCARAAYARQDWSKVIEYTERGFAIAKGPHDRPVQLMWNPMDRDYRPHVFYAAALINTGQNERALASCEIGLKLVPDDPWLKGNKEVATNNLRALAARAASQEAPAGKIPVNLRKDFSLDAPPVEMATDIAVAWALQVLWRKLLDENPASALALLDSLPVNMRTQPRVLEARAHTINKLSGGAPAPAEPASAPTSASAPAPADNGAAVVSIDAARTARVQAAGKLDILCWTGPAWEEWTPDTIKTGIGGSETAAALAMRELARRGHRVRLIGHPGMRAGIYDGVEYIHFDRTAEIAATAHPDVLIASRAPQALLDFPNARSRYIWVHDVHIGEPVGRNMEGIQRADRILALSNWHRDHLFQRYPFLAREIIVVTRNGIDTGRFAAEPHKPGNRMIWASSPDRGLERMVELLPRIRAEVPDTELHVYYGTVTWEAIAKHRGDQHALATIARYKSLLANTPGIFSHGRVGQQELADAYSASKVWGYPTWFDETSCISAMEAQAAGCVPVVAARAALNETVKYGVLINPPETTPEFAGSFVGTVVRMLRDEAFRRAYADPGRKWALENLGWDRLAAEWETLFHETLAWKAENPVAGFGTLS